MTDNIAAKINSLQRFLIKRLYDEKQNLTKSFPNYNREILNTSGSKFLCQTLVPSAILSQFYDFTVKSK